MPIAASIKKDNSVAGDRTSTDFSQREFPMLSKDFKVIQEVALAETGISLSHHKQEMIYGRIVRRVRALNLANFTEYCTYLQKNLNAELMDFTNAITTNLTYFFREPHHFEYLKDTVIPKIKSNKLNNKKLRIWSAGCSTGEEPYSLAITLKEAGWPAGWDVKILATDLDTNVVAHGKAGQYKKERFEGMDKGVQKKWFSHSINKDENGRESQLLTVEPSLQNMILFRKLNLLQQWPMKGKFDVIFCRNVVIYFSKDTQRVLFDRFADILNPNGFLFIGHSESLNRVTERFETLGRTVYRKKD
ncbi:MAG: protein-glutamate O-methyltransferase CheR [Pseudomonadales bacterium]|nr:protein-glutamate O-methyltransferase CheR [Pseudomonadales bacterium]